MCVLIEYILTKIRIIIHIQYVWKVYTLVYGRSPHMNVSEEL